LPAFFNAIAASAQGKFIPQTGAVLIKDASGQVIGAAGASGGSGDEDELICIAGTLASALAYECGWLPGNASTSPSASAWRSPPTVRCTRPLRQVKYSRVPGRCGVPAVTAPGAKSITSINPSGIGSG